MDFKTVNPATGEVIRTWRKMGRDEVMQTARLAHEAFKQWRLLSVAERVPYFRRLAAVLRDNLDDWAALVTTEMGKPITEARAEIEKCAWMTEVYADNAEAWLADEKVAADGREHIVTFQPLGVIFSIMPWNYPFWQALRFAVPGLMAGNASLLKHASNVTGCAFAIEDAFVQAGFPGNVFRTIVPDYETVSALIASDIVQGVSLTGSTQVGRHIGAEAGRNLKKVVLELGGSDPFIVLEDAEIEFTARGAVTGRMVTAGQSCIASKRFIVVEEIAEVFAKRFTELMQELKVGDPLEEATQVGSLVNEAAIICAVAAGCLARAVFSHPRSWQIQGVACGWWMKRYSVLSRRSSPSRMKPKRLSWPTAASSALVAVCGPGIWREGSESPVRWSPEPCSSTASPSPIHACRSGVLKTVGWDGNCRITG